MEISHLLFTKSKRERLEVLFGLSFLYKATKIVLGCLIYLFPISKHMIQIISHFFSSYINKSFFISHFDLSLSLIILVMRHTLSQPCFVSPKSIMVCPHQNILSKHWAEYREKRVVPFSRDILLSLSFILTIKIDLSSVCPIPAETVDILHLFFPWGICSDKFPSLCQASCMTKVIHSVRQ